MPNPEGYRKALRVMRIAEKFRRPIFTLVDTPGAYPGLGAEERGQAEAIALNLREMARILTQPDAALPPGRLEIATDHADYAREIAKSVRRFERDCVRRACCRPFAYVTWAP